MRRVFICSIGIVKVGDHWSSSLLDLAVEAGEQALEGESIKPDHIIVGNMFSGMSSRQEHLGALLANALGMEGTPAYKVEAACASGGAAVHSAYSLIRSGESDAVLVVGVEKMRDLEPSEIALALAMAESAEYTQFFGASFVSLNAMLARLYMEECGVSREALSSFSVIAHRNALTAQHAQFRKAITPEDVSRSAPISDPLRLLDCAPVGDGASALLLVAEGKLSEVKGDPVEILASTVSTNRFSLYEREDMLEFSATKKAAQEAFSKAGLRRDEVDFVEVHDAFTVVAALSLEAMGFSKRGQAPIDATKRRFDLDGELPINTFGGLKARGHPVGATGVYQLAEAYLQLSGSAGQNQVEGARLGMTHNVGGIDTTAVIHILRGRLGE